MPGTRPSRVKHRTRTITGGVLILDRRSRFPSASETGRRTAESNVALGRRAQDELGANCLNERELNMLSDVSEWDVSPPKKI